MPVDNQEINVVFQLSDQQALALAQLLKRLGWSDLRSNAVDDGETYLMQEALSELRAALAAAGYSPR